jgi:hypothetical protein
VRVTSEIAHSEPGYVATGDDQISKKIRTAFGYFVALAFAVRSRVDCRRLEQMVRD